MQTPASGLGAATIAIALIATPSLANAQTAPPTAQGASPNASATTPPASAQAPAQAAPSAPSSTAATTPAKGAATAQKGLPKLPEPPPPPDTPARLWLIAPGPREAWTMRIDNDGPRPIRIPADVRLLQFEIEVPSVDPKKKKPDVYKCSAPSSIKPSGFPERRALLLAPGQSYIESFDPRLFCFGKSAAGLVGTALVKTRFGWEPEQQPKWVKKKKPPTGPFAVESTDNPSATAPVKQLVAPSIVLSFGTAAASTTSGSPSNQASSASTTTPTASATSGTNSAPSASTPTDTPNSPAPHDPGATATPAAANAGTPSIQASSSAPGADATTAPSLPPTILGVDVNPPGAPVPGSYRPPPPVKEAPPPPPPPPTSSSLAPRRAGGRGRDVAISRKRLAAEQKEILAAAQAAKESDAASTNANGAQPPTDPQGSAGGNSAPNGDPPKNGAATNTAAQPSGTATTTTAAPPSGTTPANGAPTSPPAPPIVDQNAPKLVVEASSFSDASSPAQASVTVTVKNGGARAMTAAIRPRMISFDVVGPDRTVTCPSWPPTRALPRESFREYKPNATTSFTLLLDEVCPDYVFSRPGLYSVRAGVWANESGDDVGVAGFTGRAKAPESTLLRLQTSRDSFYIAPPRAVPTPVQKWDDDANEGASSTPSTSGAATSASTTATNDATSTKPADDGTSKR